MPRGRKRKETLLYERDVLLHCGELLSQHSKMLVDIGGGLHLVFAELLEQGNPFFDVSEALIYVHIFFNS